jgi:hypothetical protein
MKDLIKALQIFLKYGNPDYPCNCSHDELYINISTDLVSDEDKIDLDELGFFADDESDGFKSFRYGSC